jgi:hypothetical protein
MVFYIDEENKLIVKGTKTKASKYLTRNYEELGLIKILNCNHSGFGKFELDLSIFGYTEEITATSYFKRFEIEIPEVKE